MLAALMALNESTRLLLVEGVPGIGKSTLINSLIRKYVGDAQRIRSLLHLTQAHTYHPLSPDEPASRQKPEQNLAHLEQILGLLDWMAASVARERRKMFFCVIDTLHITHCFRPGVIGWDDVSTFDRRLSQLGCKLVFLKATRDEIWERTILARKDNEFITYYSRKYGDSLESIHNYYVQEQEKMSAAVEKSAMEKLVISCDRPVSEMSEIVFDYWMR